MGQKSTQYDSFPDSGNSIGDIAKQKRVIFGDELPTYPEMEAIYLNEVVKRSKHEKAIMSRLSGLKEKDFLLRLKKINKKKGKV